MLLGTLHNDLRIPYVTEVIRTYAKHHKNRTAQNNNQLIRDLFNQPEIGRRLNRMIWIRLAMKKLRQEIAIICIPEKRNVQCNRALIYMLL
jgi:hypothetical protein